MQKVVEKMTPENGAEIAGLLQELGVFLSVFSTELLPQYVLVLIALNLEPEEGYNRETSLEDLCMSKWCKAQC